MTSSVVVGVSVVGRDDEDISGDSLDVEMEGVEVSGCSVSGSSVFGAIVEDDPPTRGSSGDEGSFVVAIVERSAAVVGS